MLSVSCNLGLPSNMESEQNNHIAQLETLMPENVENAPNRHKKKIFKRPIFWIAFIFVLFLLVIIISLVVYSHVYEDEDEKHLKFSPTNQTCTFTGFLNLTDPCLWDFWIKHKQTFQERINNLYEKSPSLQYYFLDANIDYNSISENKSAVIKLEFSSPSKTSEYFISTELVEGILMQDIHDSACQHSNKLLDAFQVTLLSL
ncbi:TPA-induced transmembrane protein [Aquarana catesbeiana]|uniref:TPA-induced transmembrane protein n=1 Tax=Aquarana catesbeiana TaxID=8400 RepID=UPI003CC98B6D